jgi:protein-S-isoprenylcysteine O-methyltransferase Ste14
MATNDTHAYQLIIAPRIYKISDFFGRMTLVIIFGALATNQTLGAIALFQNGSETRVLDLAIAFASIFFTAVVIGLTIMRIEPIRSAIGLEPRLSALVGAFLSVSLIAVAPADLGTGLRVTSLILIMAGSVMSTCALLSLGRAFSVTAQARRLVVTGPYAIVRHPLYLCEEISVLGIALAHLSAAAVLIVAVQWVFQLRRMTNEEKVIDATFPEYAAYAAKTPKIVPLVLSRMIPIFSRRG